MSRAEDFVDAVKLFPLVLGLILLVIVGYYAINTLMAVGVTLVIVVVAGFIIWIAGGRLWDKFRHGKPIRRGGNGGGDSGA